MLLCRTAFRFAQTHVEPNHGSVNVDPVVGIFRFGQIKIRHMHEVDTSGNGIAGVEIVSNAAAQHESKCEVLSLRPNDAFGSLSINVAEPEA